MRGDVKEEGREREGRKDGGRELRKIGRKEKKGRKVGAIAGDKEGRKSEGRREGRKEERRKEGEWRERGRTCYNQNKTLHCMKTETET